MSVRHEDLLCGVDTARDDVAQHDTVQGIDFLEIVNEPLVDNQRVLVVSFLPKSGTGQTNLEAMLDDLQDDVENVKITGGVRVRAIEIVEVKRDGNQLRIRVDQPGDFSDYTLTINHPALHPAYASVLFNFKAACPSHFDCRADTSCPAPEELTRTIDYLARDYASFRQALFDLIPTIHPDWIERSPADAGTALIELMAYAADHLSYYQDAVANEAWLETARQRISVRRHTRLINYAMHDGASARVFVHLTANDVATIADGTQILTRLTGMVAGRDTHAPVIVGYGPAAARAAQAAFEVYGGGASVHPDLNELPVYAWGRSRCCLPTGTTRCDVDKDVTALLKKGDFLLLEELHPATLLPDDTQPSHRQVVRLVDVQAVLDPLQPQKTLTRLIWDDEDALTFPLCVALANETGGTTQTGVARGNIVLADHGRTIDGEWFPEPPGPDAKGIALRSGRAFRYFLREGPLSFRIAADAGASAASLRVTDPHSALAEVTELVPATTDGTPLATGEWKAQTTLLSSNATATHFVVETNNDGRAMLRFGDGVAGMLPPDGSLLRARYRVGAGTSGNVAPGALAHIVGNAQLPVDGVRNPLASWGGVAPEDLDEVRLTAPAAMRAHSERAVTEDDYARAAMKHPQVAKAVATFRWTGTWHTVFVTIDPKGRAELTEQTQESVREWLTRYVQTGYDLEIDPPRYVPVELGVEVCVAPGHFRTDVEKAIAAALSRSRGGFFDPDRFSFGEPLYLSQVYAAITAVEGVGSAEVTEFHRYGDPPAGELGRGAIGVGRTEVIRLDNDPNFPDNGLLKLTLRSGK